MISVSLASRGLDVAAWYGSGMRCYVEADKPIKVRVSRVISLGKVSETHELFYLADGDVYLLYDGTTFSVKKHV